MSTSATVVSGRHHFMSNASQVNNCIMSKLLSDTKFSSLSDMSNFVGTPFLNSLWVAMQIKHFRIAQTCYF